MIDPQGSIVDTYPNQMPSFQGQLDDLHIRAMYEFIKHLDEVVDENGNPIE